MNNKKNLKKFPQFNADEEAERFVETVDLSEYDFSDFKPMNFEFENKGARVNMRLPKSQLAKIKAEAKNRHIPYQRFMRDLLTRGLQTLK